MYPGFDSIKYFYDINCYTNEDIQTYVQLDAITQEEYKKITGEDYPDIEQSLDAFGNKNEKDSE